MKTLNKKLVLIGGGLLAFLLFVHLLFPSSSLLAQDKAGPKAESTGGTVTKVAVDQATLDKGKRLYLSNCISCHNKDPNTKGSLGPELTDAPLEVMTAKVMTGVYPEKLPAGFVPKRKTKLMRKIPKLQGDIPAIYAWIQSVKKK